MELGLAIAAALLWPGQAPGAPDLRPHIGPGASAARAPAQRHVPQAPAIAQNSFLRTYDRDGDGRLSPKELPERIERRFERADTNRDGLLDPGEILNDRGRIGQLARKMEDLRPDRDRRLFHRGREPSGAPLILAVEVMQRLDVNRDGYVDLVELEAGLHQPSQFVYGSVAPPVAQPSPSDWTVAPRPRIREAAPGAALPPGSNAPALGAALPRVVPQPSVPPPTPAPRPQSAPRPPRITADGYPSVDAILDNLDANGNRTIERSEAVDRLAENFNRVDRNNDGRLDAGELDRALRLARMLGIKPMIDPQAYGTGRGSPSAPAPRNRL
jgi:Ca2+-binding EF-hand superfamily protein